MRLGDISQHQPLAVLIQPLKASSGSFRTTQTQQALARSDSGHQFVGIQIYSPAANYLDVHAGRLGVAPRPVPAVEGCC